MLLLVDKTKGCTSFDVIRRLKRLYPGQKIGHSGTLDPMATGLLLIGVGKDTKRLTELTGLDKTYITTIDFSKDTDTWDMDFWEEYKEYPVISIERDDASSGLQIDGNIIPAPTREQLEEKLQSIIPSGELPLTNFSAKKIGGKKLYELAREGVFQEITKTMRVHSFKVIDYSFPLLTLEISVGSGTYIRSIGHWLGKEFGLGGTLCVLRRTKVGEYAIDDRGYDDSSFDENDDKRKRMDSMKIVEVEE